MEHKRMTLTAVMRAVLAAVLSVAMMGPVAAQDGFAPAMRVGARVISQYEVKQRVLMMTLLRQPGDITEAAMSSLIDDALRRQAARDMDVTVSPEEVTAGMTEFASRAKLDLEPFLKALAQGGVEPETLRDYIEAGLLWRSVIRAKYAKDIVISDAEIDRAIGAGAASGGEVRVLLSEIVLPTGGATDAMALAQRIKLTATNPQMFGMAAQNYSKAGTARAGGSLGWIPASALPPAVAQRVLALKVGEVTDPISVPGAVQLFLLRDLSVAGGDAVGAPEVDYAQFFAPTGTDLARIRAGLDTCDDLYDAARATPDALQRATAAEASLPAPLGRALAALDPGETTVLDGTLVMLCSRQPRSAIAPSREDVNTNLLNKKLGMLAGTYLTELKSNTFISTP